MDATEYFVLPLDVDIATVGDPRWPDLFPGVLARGVLLSALCFRSCQCEAAWSGEDLHDLDCPVEPLLGRTAAGGRRYAIGAARADEKGLRFRVCLYGAAARAYEPLIDALASLRHFGVGPLRQNVCRVEIRRGQELVYDSGTEEIRYPGIPDNLIAPWRYCAISEVPDVLRLRIVGPLDFRWRCRAAPEEAISPAGLGQAFVRRWNALAEGPTKVDRAIDGWLESLRGVDMRLEDARWVDRMRWSSRKKRWVPMGGLLGSIVLSGGGHEVVALADALSLLPIGHQTTFGHGVIVRE